MKEQRQKGWTVPFSDNWSVKMSAQTLLKHYALFDLLCSLCIFLMINYLL